MLGSWPESGLTPMPEFQFSTPPSFFGASLGIVLSGPLVQAASISEAEPQCELYLSRSVPLARGVRLVGRDRVASAIQCGREIAPRLSRRRNRGRGRRIAEKLAAFHKFSTNVVRDSARCGNVPVCALGSVTPHYIPFPGVTANSPGWSREPSGKAGGPRFAPGF